MAQTSYIDLTPEGEDLFFKNLTSQDRFTFPRITRKVALLSVKRKLGVSQRSFLPAIALLWNAFSIDEKQAWTDAANIEKGLVNLPVVAFGSTEFGTAVFGDDFFGVHITESIANGWRLFVQDQSIRIKNDIVGVATPSLLHQSWVGFLDIEAPATKLKIAQYHPRSYWVSRKVYGIKGMYVPVNITEDVSLPMELELNYKSNLTSQGAGSFAKVYAEVRSTLQGQDRDTNLEINLDLITDWKNASNSLTTIPGQYIGYTIYFHLYNMRGTIYVDNIKLTHSSQNWVRDPYCRDLNQLFTRAFYQIPKHWASVEQPEGSDYGSAYPT
jgi:hypothetical protein